MLPPTSRKNSRRKSRLASFIILVLWFTALGFIGFNHQNLADWYILRNYQAPAPVAELATQDTLTDYARKVFYVNSPSLDDKAKFNDSCSTKLTQHEQTIVLGCYHGNQGGIFLLKVTDERLNGVEQVTAAHEMLHAAYDRLSTAEKKKINGLLVDYYHNELRDPRVQKTMEAYKKTEPNDLVNEMHSIFGTEISSLPKPLEDYYQRYFSNRQKVAAYAAQYQAVFTSRQDALAQYEAQLARLKLQIENTETDLKAKQATINARQDALLSQRDNGNLAQYNAGVPAYNSLVNEYNQEIAQLDGLIQRHNQLVAVHNALVLESSQLQDELNAHAKSISQ